VEGRVEDGDMYDGGKQATGLNDRANGRRVVQRRERRQLADRVRDVLVHDDRLAEAQAPVDDAVADCGDPERRGLERFDGL
jgi:hypothetical protein